MNSYAILKDEVPDYEEVRRALGEIAFLDDVAFTQIVRELQRDFPNLRYLDVWTAGIRQEIDMRLLVKAPA